MARAFQKVGLGERPALRILLQYVFLPVPCGLSSPHALASVGPASASSSGRSVACVPYFHIPTLPAAFQVTLENCSSVSDTQCGCQPGWFPDCSTDPCKNGSPFICLCSDCETTTRRETATRRETTTGRECPVLHVCL